MGSGSTKASRRRTRRALLAAGVFCLLFAASAFAAIGGLTQKAGTAGCISETGTAGACVDGTALDGFIQVGVASEDQPHYLKVMARPEADASALVGPKLDPRPRRGLGARLQGGARRCDGADQGRRGREAGSRRGVSL